MKDEIKNVGWEHFSHRADIGVRGFGPEMEQAFEQAAIGLTAVTAEPGSVEAREQVRLSCSAPDEELMFVEWLNRLVYEMDVRKMLFRRFEVHISNGRLEGTAWGEKVDVAKHQPAVEVKGATYTALSVRREEDGSWTAQCVVDV